MAEPSAERETLVHSKETNQATAIFEWEDSYNKLKCSNDFDKMERQEDGYATIGADFTRGSVKVTLENGNTYGEIVP